MKLTGFLLFIAVLHVNARGIAQTVTYEAKATPLAQVFSAIKKQTGYVFFYNNRDLQGAAPVTVKLQNTPLREALEAILASEPVTFDIQGNTVVIARKETVIQRPEGDTTVKSKTIKVKGRVRAESGQPLSGANITIKETGNGTIADQNGDFELREVPIDGTLVCSFVGYTTKIIGVKGETTILFYLSVAVNELDRSVVQAYGVTSRRLTTSDIGKVTSEEIARQPVMNPLLALQGKVAGLDVVQTSGYASAPIRVELRGRNTIDRGFTSDPLYIVDGVPLTVLELNGQTYYTTGSKGFNQSLPGPANGQSPFFSINPADIESIEVLKDADATAIYGSRGANGVILVTTKKGVTGATRFDFSVNEGVTKVTRYWHMMNTQQYLQMRREALANDGIIPSLAHGDYDLLQFDTTRYTDWQKAVYGGTGRTLDVQAGLSGGNINTTFRLGAGYGRSTDIETVSGSSQRGSMSFNLNHHSSDQRVSISFSTGYSVVSIDMIGFGGNVLTLPPDAPSIYDSVGNLNFAGWGSANSPGRQSYPFGNLKDPYSAQSGFLNSSLVLSYQPIRGLKISSNFGYNNSQANQHTTSTIASQDPANNPTGSSTYGNTHNYNWTIDPNITYDITLGKGRLSALVGSHLQETHTDVLFSYGSGYTNDDIINLLSAAPNPYMSNNVANYKYAQLFGRINYNWEGKYSVSLNTTRDGSSRFGPDRQFGDFGDIAAAWSFSEEKWVKLHLPFLSFGKLTGSYGTTGGDGIGDYGYLTRWGYPDGASVPYNGYLALRATQHSNPDYQWQVTKKMEMSIGLGFFKDRLTLNAVWYRNRSNNQLLSFPLPALTGFTSVTANSPALVQNSGWEFTMNSQLIETKNFHLSVNANAAINKNKLLAYPNIGQSPYAYSLIVGQSLNIVERLHYTGVNPQNGVFTFADKNHDGQLNGNPGITGDLYPYDQSPKIFGGVGINLGYRAFQLSLSFSAKDQIGPNGYLLTGSIAGTAMNMPTEIIGQEWRKPGDKAMLAKFTTNPDGSFVNNSDFGFTDASFIRLSNIALSYTLPATYLKQLKIQACSLFIHTNNIFVITKYKGPDPETQNFGGLPPVRALVAGLSLNF